MEAMDYFRGRFQRPHQASMLAMTFAVLVLSIFVLGRLTSSQGPTPLISSQELEVELDKRRCSFRCDDNGPAMHLENCSCGDVCHATFSFTHDTIGWVRFSSIVMLLVALVAVLWDAQYLACLYFVALPSCSSEAVHVGWLRSWLQSYNDPLHAAALWTLWGQVLALSVSPPADVPGPFPSLRDFAAPGARAAAGWGATGKDELAVWLALVGLAGAALALLCATPATALSEGPAVSPASQWQARAGVGGLALVASCGFVLGQPISGVYAFMATVPWWLVQAVQGARGSWPLERPFPGFKSPWALAQARELAFKEAMTDLGEEGRLQALCHMVEDQQRAEPWRAAGELEIALQEQVLAELRSALDARDATLLRRLLHCASLLRYSPPAEEEAAEEPQSSCCSGYQRLGNSNEAPVRDEAWSASVHTALLDGLRAAAVARDDSSLRWAGVVLAALRPDVAAAASGSLAQAAAALGDALGEWPASDLYGAAALAVQLWPCAEMANRRTAFAWALRLPSRQARATLALLMEQACGSGGADCGLEMLQGSRTSVEIKGRWAFALQPSTVAAPALAVREGRWFFEVRVLGGEGAKVGWRDGEMWELAAGVVGCALQVKGGGCEAWFAVDGDWASWGKQGRRWNSRAAPAPAACGRFACEFAFDAAEFAYGPPDGSFIPLLARPPSPMAQAQVYGRSSDDGLVTGAPLAGASQSAA